MKELIKRLSKIQKELKAPKNQFNAFGKYKYRSCEDILEGIKNVIGDDIITMSDNIEQIGDRFYIKSTATFTDGENSISSTAYARESLTKKGMDDSQVTGTASSYARKYALNGLLLIDDSKDADSQDNSVNPKEVKKEIESKTPLIKDEKLKESLLTTDIDQLRGLFKSHNLTDEQKKLVTNRGIEIKKINEQKKNEPSIK